MSWVKKTIHYKKEQKHTRQKKRFFFEKKKEKNLKRKSRHPSNITHKSPFNNIMGNIGVPLPQLTHQSLKV